MKKIITSILFVILTITIVQAQGNLQFNQVIKGELFSSNSSNNYVNVTLGSIVVPVGKVLKIESVSMQYQYSSVTYAFYDVVSIDKHLVWAEPDNPVRLLPLWLPEGSYPVVFKNTSNGSGYTYEFSYSAVEFNVIP